MKFLSHLSKKKLENKICLLRIDLNVERTGIFSKDHPRFLAILPTINFLRKNKVKILLLSHYGRYASCQNRKKVAIGFKKMSLKPAVKVLSSLIEHPVQFINFSSDFFLKHNFKDIFLIDHSNIETIKHALPGSVFLLENLRFFIEEEKNNKLFAQCLASLGDFYVNDAFAVSHRNNASMVGITKFLPAYAGLALEKEIKTLNWIVSRYQKPLVFILGGAKVSDKLGVIKNFLDKADCFLVGGGIANTFLAASGFSIGKSFYEAEMINRAKQILKTGKIILPIDFKVENQKILDIGSKTLKIYKQIIRQSRSLIWNGPLGYIENKKFRKGSEEIMRTILEASVFAVIGGGETSALFNKGFLRKRLYRKNFFISTGGGAMLDYLSGKAMPALRALDSNKFNL